MIKFGGLAGPKASKCAVLVQSVMVVGAVTTGSLQAEAQERAYSSAFGEGVRSYLLDNPNVVLEVFTLLEHQKQTEQSQAASASISRHSSQLFASDDARKGTPDAPIVVVEFFDYSCGYCKAALPELTQAMAGRDDVTVVMKEFPILGAASEKASRLALAVRAEHGDEAYLGFHNALLSQKGQLNYATLSMLVGAAGYDFTALAARSVEADISATIAENKRLAQSLSINGTPAFVFEDELVGGMMTADRLTAKFDMLAQSASEAK